MNDHPNARALGGLTGILLAVVAGLWCTSAIKSAGATGYDAVGPGVAQFFLAVVIGIPLLLANISIMFYLQNRNAAQGMLPWMWLPTALVLALALGYQASTSNQEASYEREHPAITERHVNLSGRALWLAPEVSAYPLAAEPGEVSMQYRTMSRKKHDDPMAEYAGTQLAPGLTSINVWLKEPAGAAPTRMPLVVAPPPDLTRIASAFTSTLPPRLVYMYYHYPDRVEVAPALNLWSSSDEHPPTAQVPLAFVVAHNLTGAPIVRLEIDGLTLELETALAPTTQETYCKFERLPVINQLAAPLKVRWQAARTAPAWQEARVAVPPFAQAAPDQGTARENAVHLFFLPDGGIAARRTQVLMIGASGRAVRLSAIAPALKTALVCGDAATSR